MPSLTAQELERIDGVLGEGVSTLASSAARLYKAADGANSWSDGGATGALVFTSDSEAGTHALRVFDVESFKPLFEQEIYEGFEYIAVTPWFHQFETETECAAFSFADDDEGRAFYSSVADVVPRRRKGLRGKIRKGLKGAGALFHKEREAAIKFEIGLPTNVVHESHMGWDNDKGFVLENIPPEWKAIFSAAGVTEGDLRNEGTAKEILKVVMSAASTTASPAPPAPPRRAGGSHAAGAPPPPPPPPPPGGAARGGAGAPPPPPPPPPGKAAAGPRGDLMSAIRSEGGNGLKPASATPSRPAAPVDPRSAMLGAIAGGASNLKPVDKTRELPPIKAAEADDMVACLSAALDKIRNAVATREEESDDESEQEWSD